jgi:HTH-type transcriptional regulator / antitoxin HigA
METQLIETPEDYAAALKEIAALISAEPGSAEGRRLDMLAHCVQNYEAQQFPMELPGAADDVTP